MIWVSWRRQRPQLITLLAVLVVGAGAVVLLRSNMVDTINSLQLNGCVTRVGPECLEGGRAADFQEVWTTRLNLGQAAILALPALIGVFIGAPLFARELEQGTHVLAFTQSVSRTRWMSSKLVVALAPALVVLIALQSLVSWWLSAAGLLGPRSSGSFHFLNFGIEHASPVAHALFAFALGTFVGVVSRRTLVAMTVTLSAFTVVRFALSDVVGRLVPTQRLEVAAGESLAESRGGNLAVESGWLDAAGQRVSTDRADALAQACKTTAAGVRRTQEEWLACLPRSGLAKQYATFVPEGHAWQVHLVDASIFGGLAVLLLAGTAWVLRRQS
ncbi:ABC transporter permease [Actinokineospora spheciospongiae]|uniref:ABC transporter permease n=1 Tax=Actinokineospora spheciospongiae TaxID=909613 RepID=UPI000D717068|nr:ABC transporter permease [Actinokineospora spheciospongiae]PWW62070.1 ABC-2 family transporter [Actinokineospora spheciospongiae]